MPGWTDRYDILAALRASNYDVQDCVTNLWAAGDQKQSAAPRSSVYEKQLTEKDQKIRELEQKLQEEVWELLVTGIEFNWILIFLNIALIVSIVECISAESLLLATSATPPLLSPPYAFQLKACYYATTLKPDLRAMSHDQLRWSWRLIVGGSIGFDLLTLLYSE